MSDGGAASGAGAASGSQAGQAGTQSSQQTAQAAQAGESSQRATASPETAEAAETKAEKTTRQKFFERMKTYHPDHDFDGSDEDANFQKMLDTLSDHETYRENNKKYNDKIIDIFEAEPGVVEVMKEMFEGAPFIDALSRHYDLDAIKPKEGEPDWESYKKNVETRNQRKLEKEKQQNEFQENYKYTSEQLKQFIEENSLEEAAYTPFLNSVDKLLIDAYNGKISKDLLSLLYKGHNHDNDVQTAKSQGEVKARNEKIVAEKLEKKGDGLPSLGGAGALETSKPAQVTPETQLVNEITQYSKKRKTLGEFLKKP